MRGGPGDIDSMGGPLFSSPGRATGSYPLAREPATAGDKSMTVRRGGREGISMTKLTLNRRSVLGGAGAAATSLATGVRVAHAADPVKVGVLFPLTGNAAAAGQASKTALEVAADIVNNAHPELANIPLAKD